MSEMSYKKILKLNKINCVMCAHKILSLYILNLYSFSLKGNLSNFAINYIKYHLLHHEQNL